ncbi:MAG: carboxypeptidase regulatory-like domain-containing protein, partial [Selenomonadaceae bacterium]|nr:carboxypeptidase regulatory-like domain-containing protein [Selenomonadaceae bacterium]
MKKIFAIFIVAFFALSFSAPNAEAADWGKILGDVFGSGGSSGGSSTKVGRLAGKVTDKTGAPLEGILVTYSLNGGGQNSVKTNSNGNYVLNVYRSGSCQIIISGETWRTQIHDTSGFNENNVWNFTMRHNYMTGKVTDRNGVPLQGVKFVFEQDGSASGVQEVYTDANGNYKYVIPKSGAKYWITISKDGYQLQRHHFNLLDEEIWNITM